MGYNGDINRDFNPNGIAGIANIIILEPHRIPLEWGIANILVLWRRYDGYDCDFDVMLMGCIGGIYSVTKRPTNNSKSIGA